MGTLWQDLRYSLRTLLKKPGVTAVAVITLAAGIGLNTAIFSVVHAILLRPLPYQEPERLVQVWETHQPSETISGPVSPDNFLSWREHAQSFEQLSTIRFWLFSLTGTSEPTEISGMQVSTNFFTLLGVTLQRGRAFLPEENQPDKSRVVVISHGFWQRRFGGDADIIGKTIRLDDGDYTIIGVLRPDFRQTELVVDYRAEVWTPLVLNPAANNRGNHYLRVIGRLKPGVALDQAQAELVHVASQLEQAYPETNTDRSVRLVPLHEQITGGVRWALLLLQCATGFVLLIACTNVANLLLARVAGREKEIAVRSALGASVWRLVRLLLVESLALAVAGGAVGFLLALWGVEGLVSVAPSDIPRLGEIGPDGWTFGFTLALSLLTVIFFGLMPAWQATRINLNESLKEGGRSATRGQGLRGLLVVAEVALTVMLLIGAGLMLRSLVRLQNVDLGFNPDNLLTLRVSLLDSKYPERQRVANFYQQALARVETLPGVQSAAITSSPPLIRLGNIWNSFEIEGQPTEPGRAPTARYRLISPDYFRTMNISMIDGRAFTERDTGDAPPVMIVNERFARRYFVDTNPIGKKIIVGRTAREIVGVVADSKHEALDADDEAGMYVPHAQNPRGTVMMVVRAASDPNRLTAAVSKVIWEGDPDAAVSTVATMEQVLAGAVSRPRFNTLLLGLFAAVALVLAAVGVYGVMSYTVTQSRREIGIRLALGAQTTDVLKLVVGQGLILTLAGLGIGLAGAFGLTQLMARLLYGVTPTDPVTFVAVPGVLMIATMLACYIPARRATRVDPMVALRYE